MQLFVQFQYDFILEYVIFNFIVINKLTTSPQVQAFYFFLLKSYLSIILSSVQITPNSISCIFIFNLSYVIKMHTCSSYFLLQFSLSVV